MPDVKYLNRAAIRQMVLARMGWSTDDQNLSAQVVNQINEFIRQGCTATLDISQWQPSTVEATFITGIDQQKYNYPTQDVDGNIIVTGPQCILEVARFDTDGQAYVMLRRRRIPISLAIDESLSGTDVINKLAKPLIYELRSQLLLWPIPDQAYTIRCLVTQDPDISSGANPDANVSVVDAEAIAIYATALCKREDGDLPTANSMALGADPSKTEWGRHVIAIRRAMSSLPLMQPGRNDELRRRYRNRATYLERYGRDRWLDG